MTKKYNEEGYESPYVREHAQSIADWKKGIRIQNGFKAFYFLAALAIAFCFLMMYLENVR